MEQTTKFLVRNPRGAYNRVPFPFRQHHFTDIALDRGPTSEPRDRLLGAACLSESGETCIQ